MSKLIAKNGRRTKIIVGILISQLVLAISGSIWLISWHAKNRYYFVGEIVIYRNEDFTNYYNFPGNGTKEDPYRIENLVINTKLTFGIKINGTSSHFIIRNCSVSAKFPIVLVNVSYGTARIENNTIYGQYRPAIELIYCPGSIIDNNILFGSASYCRGITTTGCYDSVISNNICNDLEYGMYLLGLNDNLIVRNNTCNNNVNGIYFTHEDYYLLQGGYIESQSIVIENNTCTNNEVGIIVLWVLNSSIVGNNCSYNSDYGYRGRGWNLTFERNYFGFNDIGLDVDYLTNSLIKNNVFYNNTGVAIEAKTCSNTTIYANNFINNYYEGILQNRSQVYDDSSAASENGPNSWYNATLSQGNYWSELIWFPGVTYAIRGSDNEDVYPLENPVEI